jgi:hypothetical protein
MVLLKHLETHLIPTHEYVNELIFLNVLLRNPLAWCRVKIIQLWTLVFNYGDQRNLEFRGFFGTKKNKLHCEKKKEENPMNILKGIKSNNVWNLPPNDTQPR